MDLSNETVSVSVLVKWEDILNEFDNAFCEKAYGKKAHFDTLSEPDNVVDGLGSRYRNVIALDAILVLLSNRFKYNHRHERRDFRQTLELFNAILIQYLKKKVELERNGKIVPPTTNVIPSTENEYLMIKDNEVLIIELFKSFSNAYAKCNSVADVSFSKAINVYTCFPWDSFVNIRRKICNRNSTEKGYNKFKRITETITEQFQPKFQTPNGFYLAINQLANMMLSLVEPVLSRLQKDYDIDFLLECLKFRHIKLNMYGDYKLSKEPGKENSLTRELNTSTYEAAVTLALLESADVSKYKDITTVKRPIEVADDSSSNEDESSVRKPIKLTK